MDFVAVIHTLRVEKCCASVFPVSAFFEFDCIHAAKGMKENRENITTQISVAVI